MCDNIQFGIVSGGHGCGLKGFAGTYTNLQKYADFIEKTISAATCKSLTLNNIVWIVLCFVFLNRVVITLED